MAVAEQPLTARRADVEAWLDERHVQWEFVEALPVDQIDQVASLGNQARLEPLSEEVVDRYAADMERGDKFPPIVARRHGRRLVLVGGNHRTAAARRAQIQHLAAYVITVEPEMAVRLTYEDNRRHGLPPSEEERLHQAVHLVNNGYSQVQAAELAGVSVPKVNNAIGLARANQRASTMGVRGWDRLPKSVRTRIQNVHSDPVFAAAAQLAADTAMTQPDADKLIVRLNATRSEAAALQVVDEETTRRAGDVGKTAGGVIRKATARTKLLGAITTATSLTPGAVAQACATPDQRDALKKQVTSAIRALETIAKEL